MIYLFIYWLYYGAFFFLVGFHVCDGIAKYSKGSTIHWHISHILLAGVAATTYALTLLHFFVPINTSVHLAFIGLILVLSWLRAKKIRDYCSRLFTSHFTLLPVAHVLTNTRDGYNNKAMPIVLAGVFLFFGYIFILIPFTYQLSIQTAKAYAGNVTVYYDTGNGYNEHNSAVLERQPPSEERHRTTLLSHSHIVKIRFDIGSPGEIVRLDHIQINDQKFSGTALKEAFIPLHDIELLSNNNGQTSYLVTGNDPAFELANFNDGSVVGLTPYHLGFLLISAAATLLLVSYRRKLSATINFAVKLTALNSKTVIICCLVLSLLAIIAIYLSGIVQGYPSQYDTDLYHAQTVQWTKEYPVVPGLGNIHLRLAFNNSWFLLAAFVDVFHFYGKSYHILNSFCYLTVVASLISFVVTGCIGKARISSLFSLVLALPLIYYTEGINSLSTDVICNLLVVYLVLQLLVLIETSIESGHLYLLLLLVCFGITLKLTFVPLVLIPFLFIPWPQSQKLYKRRFPDLRQLFLLLLSAIILLSPWLLSGILQTGYFFWPLPGIDVFPFDWKIPAEYIKMEILWIKSWPYGISPDVFVRENASYWLFIWLAKHWAALFGTILLICVFYLTLRRSQVLSPRAKRLTILHLILSFAVLYWLVNAPDIRFGFGIATSYIGMMAASSLFVIAYRRQVWLKIAGILTLVSIIYASLHGIADNGLTYADLPGYRTYPTEIYNFPSGMAALTTLPPEDRCGNAPIPCIPFHYKRFNLEKRGESLSDGFRRINNNR